MSLTLASKGARDVNKPLLIGLAGIAALLIAAPPLYSLISGSGGSPEANIGQGGDTSVAPYPDRADYPKFNGEAFPGAEGFGRFARGGRNGRIIEVTTLADSGPGSLRACLEAEGSRVCVFKVGGVIRFTSERPIIRNPYLTIAGQTAPGGGILLTHGGGAEGFTPLVIKGSHDVVVRHVRVRTDLNGDKPGSNGSFLYEDSNNVIFDHVSGSWALDQIMSGYSANDRISVTWSIFAKGIPKHDKCALLASDPKGPQNLSFIRNLCAHNGDRNPDVNFPPGSCVELVNNVLYNAMSQFTEVHENFGGTPVNIVGNYYKSGPNTRVDRAAVDRVLVASKGPSKIYLADNQLDGLSNLMTPAVAPVARTQPVCPLTVRPVRPAQAYREVLDWAGAFPRDAFDARTVAEVRSGRGSILRNKAAQQGPRELPHIAGGTPYADADRDGMSDRWEKSNGLDARKNDAWGDVNRNGWPNLDEFLDYAHRQVMSGRSVQ